MQGETNHGLFDEYAEVYAAAPYGDFTDDVAARLPKAWAAVGKSPRSLLDLGCGTGTLAIALAPALDRVTGLDQSPSMLRIAAAAVARAGVDVELVPGDLVSYRPQQPYDLVTCTYNTVNYVVDPADLAGALRSMRAAVAPGGLLVLDAHPAWFIEEVWAGQTFVEQNTDDILEVWENPYDQATGILRTAVTIFRRGAAGWSRIREVHPTRGYGPDVLLPLFDAAGFTSVRTAADLDLTPVDERTERVWYFAS